MRDQRSMLDSKCAERSAQPRIGTAHLPQGIKLLVDPPEDRIPVARHDLLYGLQRFDAGQQRPDGAVVCDMLCSIAERPEVLIWHHGHKRLWVFVRVLLEVLQYLLIGKHKTVDELRLYGMLYRPFPK